ncbi:MAG: hypothetical protein R2820_14005 [Cyclobacteriaceae bacterium]|nr:hypothetical protein [Cyclobacteriaceae bacterium]
MTKMKLSGLLILSLALPLLFASCKKDDPDPLEQRINELTASWKLGTVTNDSQDVTSQYSGFTLVVTGNNYTTTNGGNPWPVSGTYEVRADNLNTIIRSDGTTITIDEITSSTLVLSFNYAGLSSGRVKGVTGSFTFSLVK